MCQILLSIKPEYVDKILDGTKKFEYRKNRCSRRIDKIVIYATSPIMRIVGEAEVLTILEAPTETIWEQTKDYSGISRQFFDTYFKNRKTAVAYQLGKVKKYKKPISLNELGITSAPQSFVYLTK